MSRFLPSIHLIGATLCEREGEAEGWTIELRWRRFIAQFTLARFEK